MYLDWMRNCLKYFFVIQVRNWHWIFWFRLLHTQAKSHDHEIVSAQKKCPKVVSKLFQNHVMWSHALKCDVKSYVTEPSIKY